MIKIIGKWIEKYSGITQIVFLLFILIIGVLYPILDIKDSQTIIIDLLVLTLFEILFLIIGNEKIKNKLHSMCSSDQIKKSNMVSINTTMDGYEKFSELLSCVHSDLFISGITCSGICRFNLDIADLLDDECNVNVLISSEDALKSNALINTDEYYEGKMDENMFEDVQLKYSSFLKTTIAYPRLKEALKNGKLKIRTTNVPFTIACVGVNIFGEKKGEKKLKITQYIVGHETNNCPNMIINSVDNADLYDYYVGTLKKLWYNADPLKMF